LLIDAFIIAIDIDIIDRYDDYASHCHAIDDVTPQIAPAR